MTLNVTYDYPRMGFVKNFITYSDFNIVVVDNRLTPKLWQHQKTIACYIFYWYVWEYTKTIPADHILIMLIPKNRFLLVPDYIALWPLCPQYWPMGITFAFSTIFIILTHMKSLLRNFNSASMSNSSLSFSPITPQVYFPKPMGLLVSFKKKPPHFSAGCNLSTCSSLIILPFCNDLWLKIEAEIRMVPFSS